MLARLDGSVEFLELSLTTESVGSVSTRAERRAVLFLERAFKPTRVTSIALLNVIRAHQKPISHLSSSSLTVVSASYDHTLKLFDLRTCQLQSMLHAHSGPVTAVCMDHDSNVRNSHFLYY